MNWVFLSMLIVCWLLIFVVCYLLHKIAYCYARSESRKTSLKNYLHLGVKSISFFRLMLLKNACPEDDLKPILDKLLRLENRATRRARLLLRKIKASNGKVAFNRFLWLMIAATFLSFVSYVILSLSVSDTIAVLPSFACLLLVLASIRIGLHRAQLLPKTEPDSAEWANLLAEAMEVIPSVSPEANELVSSIQVSLSSKNPIGHNDAIYLAKKFHFATCAEISSIYLSVEKGR